MHLRAVDTRSRPLPTEREPPRVAGQLPPHDLGAEAAVLSACLLDPLLLPVVRGIVRPGDWFSASHERIWRVLCDLDDAREPIDVVTVAHRLATAGWLQGVGGKPYLGQLLDETPAVANVETHARIVADKAHVRRAIRTMQRRVAEAYGDIGDDAQGWLEGVSADVARVVATGGRSGAVAVSEACGEASQALTSARPTVELSTGLRELDAITAGLHRGETCAITAPAGGGKSALAGFVSLIVAGTPDEDGERRNGVLYFSLEMPKRDLAKRWACATGQVDNGRLRHRTMGRDDADRYIRALDGISRLPILVDDRGESRPLGIDAIRAETLRQRARFEREGKRLALVVVDLYQQIDWRPSGQNKYQGLDDCGIRLRYLSSEADCAVLVPAHLNREGKIRDCPALQGHVHNWWQLELGDRDDGSDGPLPATVKLGKQRDGCAGSCGLWFHGAFFRFADEEWLR